MGWMSAKLWRSQEEEWRSNWYITRVKTESQAVWRSDQLEIRCGRENQHPAEWAPGPRLSSRGEREINVAMAHRVGVNMLQFCSVSNSLSHTALSNKARGIFSKELCRLSLLCRCYDSACIHMYMYYVAIQQFDSPINKETKWNNWNIFYIIGLIFMCLQNQISIHIYCVIKDIKKKQKTSAKISCGRFI